nr:DUF5979 domain-containing protein [uncultured Microbacterium sp.]
MRLRRIVAAVAALGIALVTLVAMPTAAYAAPNAGIVVGAVSISPADAQPTVGDTLLVSGSWDASDADPQAGDTFTIGLPPEFSFPEAVPFQLIGSDDQGNPVVWGNCLTDPATGIATCELTDAVEATPELVQGAWQFEVQAVQATTADEVEFDLNGTAVLVDLPGTGGIDDGIDLPGEVSKSGVMNQNNWSMTWTVDIPGANMVGQDTVTLRDTLGAGHQLCTPTGLKVETVRGSTVVDVTSLVATAPAAGATEFDVVLTAPEAGFDANVTYRVTYQTCTPDGQIDPEGTTYDNSAQIEGWGDAGLGIGEVQNFGWQQNLTKSGTVLGGADRNGKIAWTVTVPGDQLVGKTGFTMTEALGLGHELCTDTISGLQVTERYGPSNQLQQNITSRLTATTVSSDAQGFQVRFDIADDGLQFRASDYRYVITYTTCVTEDDLPAGGTAYTNEVDIDGQVAGTEASVPGRAQGKSGQINRTAVTLDGVAHMPQTTLNWTARIPGQMIENLGGSLSLTDAFSASLAVCEAGDPTGGLASRLGLRVEARDQVQGGGLATVNLSDVTDVTLDGNELTFEIAATDLPIPTGTSDGFTREYEYAITYTTCTASGGMDAPGTAYTNALTGSGINFTTTTTQNNTGSGTGQGVTRGSVAIDKILADTTGAALVPADAAFTVHVREIDPTGVTHNEYDLQVPLTGAPVTGLNARGTGWTVQLTEPTFPTIPGVTFGTPVFTEGPGLEVSEDGTVATASISPGTNVSVALTNEALLGSVSLVKNVEGGAADLVDAERTYRVTAQIDTTALGATVPAQPARIVDLTAGEPIVLNDLPIGATATFTETRPADDDQLTWGTPVFSPASVVVSAANATEPAAVTVTNSVERSVGSFFVVKTVTGPQADNPAVPDAVTVTATWDEEGTPGTATLTVPTDGTPVSLGVNLLVGTEVTLTETPLTDGSSIAWSEPIWAGTGVSVDGQSALVTIGRDSEATVSLENFAATSTAGISILKGVAGESAGEVDPSTEFPVQATWTDEDGVEQSRDLMITATEPTPLGVDLPAGTVVTITEGAQPEIATVIWGSITIGGTGVVDAGDGSATVTVSDQQSDVNLVTVVNEATWAPGTFSLSKTILGLAETDAERPESVTVTATWTDGDSVRSTEITVPTDGAPVEFSEQLSHGTEVTLTETVLDDSPRFTWADPAWDGDRVTTVEDTAAVVTIGAADTAEVALVNTAVATLGNLAVTKSLTGDGAARSAATEFPVTLTWTDLLGDEQTRDVNLVAGRTEVIEDIPQGTPIQVKEHATTLADQVRWVGADWTADADADTITVDTTAGSADAVITLLGDTGTTAEVSLQNELTIDPGLAITGGSAITAGVLAGVAVLLTVAGAVLMTLRRRRHA